MLQFFHNSSAFSYCMRKKKEPSCSGVIESNTKGYIFLFFLIYISCSVMSKNKNHIVIKININGNVAVDLSESMCVSVCGGESVELRPTSWVFLSVTKSINKNCF